MTSAIEVSIADQAIRFWNGEELYRYPVSTGLNGVGESCGSGCTPLGWHRVVARIGEGEPENSVFVGRRATGEIYSEALATQYPDRDWILSRILWLQGLEYGVNRGKGVDSMRRYIYIHGTPDSEPMGIPLSHGCIRMRNRDLVELFDRVKNKTLVWIQEGSFSRIPMCPVN